MTFTIWIKERNGEGAAWTFSTMHECFRCFHRMIGTNNYSRHSAYIVNSNKDIVVTARCFKKELKRWSETENKDKYFQLNYTINGVKDAVRTYQESQEDAIKFFDKTFVKTCILESVEELAV